MYQLLTAPLISARANVGKQAVMLSEHERRKALFHERTAHYVQNSASSSSAPKTPTGRASLEAWS
jgi:hypothetical protein